MALRFVTHSPSPNNLAIDVELFIESSVGNHIRVLYLNVLVKVFTNFSKLVSKISFVSPLLSVIDKVKRFILAGFMAI